MPAATVEALVVNIVIWLMILFIVFRFYVWYKNKEFEANLKKPLEGDKNDNDN